MPQKKPKRGYIVAIDGPAGAGKSTVSLNLARTLGGTLLDTGSMYRAVAYYSIREGAESEKEFARVARRLKFTGDSTGKKTLVNGRNLGRRLRTERVSWMASYVSKFKGVRDELTKQQRKLGKSLCQFGAVVVEGRDIGTVVFPDVKFKFFITASVTERARRRYEQLKQGGQTGIRFQEVLRDQRKRDRQDSKRKIAPLKRAKGAIQIDTSRLTIREVVDKMKSYVEKG